MLYKKPEEMERSIKLSLKSFAVPVITTVTSFRTFAQNATGAGVGIEGNEDPGFVSGSPWLWLLFIIVLILVIVVLAKGRRG